MAYFRLSNDLQVDRFYYAIDSKHMYFYLHFYPYIEKQHEIIL